MIRSLSPYYVTVPFVSPASSETCTSYTLNVYIWDGLKASVPATVTYSYTKSNPTASTDSDKINISRILSDYIEPTPIEGTTSGIYDADITWWVKYEYTYVSAEPTDATTPQGTTTSIYSRGYTYGNEGENITTVTDRKLFAVDEFKVDRTGFYCVPILLDESVATDITVLSYPNSEINFSVSQPSTTTSSELVQNVWVNLSETTLDTYVVVSVDAVELCTILIEDEGKYSPLDIFFINKYGCQQSFTFFKEKTDSLTITDSQFESDRGQPSAGNHQFVRFNVQGREEFRVNTGWIDEENNETIKQLLLSELIWSYDGTNFTPLNIKTKSQEWKTQQKNKLINYEIGFEYSYNEINNI